MRALVALASALMLGACGVLGIPYGADHVPTPREPRTALPGDGWPAKPLTP
ncbi:hypothetical protein SAMN02990966_03953 [Rhodospirillales bacterium URHD0017]|nr:hypothetical protein SAMN02990966_03953 [Rhodospirillales bacterium URHD0017]